jgi:4-amino-4-deoxy-L-arabinose transferase-like glycosyltransferase
MLQFIKTRWELLIALAIFIAIKIPALHYSFYLDESWSYAPGVKLMYLHGPSLMPNAIDTFYSRGHPLLFYAAAAAWMRLFGSSFVAQHSFSLVISLLLIVSVYEVSLALFNKRAALISLLLLPLQVIFFVQATMLLPEIMIALLSLLSLYFYVRGRHLYTFLCAAALVLTKESGMVMGLVLGVHATINLLAGKQPMRERLKGFLSLFAAGLLIGAFYLLQKHQNGWYLFPEHINMLAWDWHVFWKKMRYSMEVLFYNDYRFRFWQLLLLLAVVVAIHTRDLRYATPLLPGYLIYAVAEDRFSWMPRVLLLAIMFLSLIYAAYQLIHLSGISNVTTRKFIYLSVFFFIAYLLFSCINFFTARYLICLLAIEVILLAAWLLLYISALYDLIFYLTIAGILLTGFYGYKYDSGVLDINRGAFDAMKVQEHVVTYFEQEHLYDKNIFASFINREHLQKPLTGFRHTDSVFTHAGYELNDHTDYAILDNIDSLPQTNEIKSGGKWRLVFKAQQGPAWAEVYGR